MADHFVAISATDRRRLGVTAARSRRKCHPDLLRGLIFMRFSVPQSTNLGAFCHCRDESRRRTTGISLLTAAHGYGLQLCRSVAGGSVVDGGALALADRSIPGVGLVRPVYARPYPGQVSAQHAPVPVPSYRIRGCRHRATSSGLCSIRRGQWCAVGLRVGSAHVSRSPLANAALDDFRLRQRAAAHWSLSACRILGDAPAVVVGLRRPTITINLCSPCAHAGLAGPTRSRNPAPGVPYQYPYVGGLYSCRPRVVASPRSRPFGALTALAAGAPDG